MGQCSVLSGSPPPMVWSDSGPPSRPVRLKRMLTNPLVFLRFCNDSEAGQATTPQGGAARPSQENAYEPICFPKVSQ